jgi:hypothetical protein
VRHVRMLGLTAVIAALAMLSTAATALAKESAKTHKEFEIFSYCPVFAAETCIWGQSAGVVSGVGESEFQSGNITIKLRKPIKLLGGYNENAKTEVLSFVGPVGVPTVAPIPQAGPSLTKAVDTSLLSPEELDRYNYWVHQAKQTKTYATVELAVPPESVEIDLIALIEETETTALGFPVKVKLSNPFLGEDCYVGSSAHPIEIHFVTGQSGALHGALGEVSVNPTGEILKVAGDKLVDGKYEAPGVEGCGVEGGADAALNAALGLPSPAEHNRAVIVGELRQDSSETTREHGFE